MLSRIILPHILLALLTGIVLFAPKKKLLLHASGPLLAAICIIEILFLLHFLHTYRRNRQNAKHAQPGGFSRNRISQSAGAFTGICDIMVFVWGIMILWELFTAVLDLAHPVLVPAPENVFFTFYEHWRVMLLNIAYSLELLLTGMIIGAPLFAVLYDLIRGCILWALKKRDQKELIDEYNVRFPGETKTAPSLQLKKKPAGFFKRKG